LAKLLPSGAAAIIPQSGADSTQRYVVSWAQNATPVFKPFVAALKHYARHNGAKLRIVRGRYKNPTSVFRDAEKETDDWYAPEVVRYLADEREQLCPNLCLYADVPTQPTAARPLSGFEVFCGRNSGVFGHPKRALEVVATARRTPRLLATTGAVTVENYTDSKAGKKGHAHHVYGALVVEVEGDGTYHLRHVSATADGEFTDFDKVYSERGVRRAPRAAVLTMGDLHAARPEPAVLKATEALCALVQPRTVVLHDVLDFRSRNHHEKTLRRNFPKHSLGHENVHEEVVLTVGAINDVASWGDHDVVVVRSNHDAALDRWLEECDPRRDLVNAEYYFALWARLMEARDPQTHELPDAFPFEAHRIGLHHRARFLGINEELTILGVAYNFHSHRGINGSRGSPLQFARLGVKTVIGHGHAPGIWDGCFRVGVSAQIDHGYNDLPCSWLHAHALQYADGKRTIVVIVDGKFRAPAPDTRRR
jgi:hypothetical protein